MNDLLKGRVAVVTGSGQGIGRAIAMAIAEQGAQVVTNNRKPGSTGRAQVPDENYARLSEEDKAKFEKARAEQNGDAETTAQAIRDAGGEAVSFFGDISRIEDAEKLIKFAVDTYGHIDILVNVAGCFGFSDIDQIDDALWDKVNNVKPRGYFHTMKYAIPYMKEQGYGRIINTTSRAYMGDVIKHAEYCAANAGVVGLTRAAAIELREYGITVNAFSPFAKTRASYELDAMNATTSEEGKSLTVKAGAALPTYEFTPTPEMLAPFVVYLASEQSAQVSGTVFSLGGNSIQMHSEPVICRSMIKPGTDKWTLEEIMMMAPMALFSGYHSIADEYPM